MWINHHINSKIFQVYKVSDMGETTTSIMLAIAEKVKIRE